MKIFSQSIKVVVALLGYTLSVTAQTSTSFSANQNNILGWYNVGIGFGSLRSNTSIGFYNTALGYLSLSDNTNGSYNTAAGYFSLSSNINGNYNVANGYKALASNTIGSYNTAIGTNALVANRTGNNNVATGTNALFSDTSGSDNIATGFQALYSNMGGKDNIAIGSGSLFANVGGSENVAIGSQTLYSSISSAQNVAIGWHTLYNNSRGYFNTANGWASMFYNTTGTENTAMGAASLGNNTSGYSNTAIGMMALYDMKRGNYNTAVGSRSLLGIFDSSNFCTAIGVNTGSNNRFVTGVTLIGANATATSSNSIVLGDPSVTNVGYYGKLASLSDARFKKNIKEDIHGLDFITKLRAVSYNVNVKKLNSFLGIDERRNALNKENKVGNEEIKRLNNIQEKAIAEKEAIRYNGFLAQEVEQVAKSIGYDFSGVIKPVNEKDHYKMDYSDFVVPMVKAIQEQQQMIQDQQKQIEELKKMVANKDNLKISSIELGDKNSVVLDQNVPNPFANQTSISYSVPQNSSTSQIVFYDATGRAIKTARVNGKGQLNVFSNDLTSGTYSYSLVVDGKLVKSRKLMKQ